MRNWNDIGADEFVTIEEFVAKYPWCFDENKQGDFNHTWDTRELIKAHKRNPKDFIQPKHVRRITFVDCSGAYHWLDELYGYDKFNQESARNTSIPRNYDNYNNENIPKKFLEFYDEPSYLWIETTQENEEVKLLACKQFNILSVKITAAETEIAGDPLIPLNQELLTGVRIGDEELAYVNHNSTENTKDLKITIPIPGRYRVRYVFPTTVNTNVWYYRENHGNDASGLFVDCQHIVEVESNFFKCCHEFQYNDYELSTTFSNCTNLRVVNAPFFSDNLKSHIGYCGRIFENCYSLERFDTKMFQNCTRIETIYLPFLRCACNLLDDSLDFYEQRSLDIGDVSNFLKGCPNLINATIFGGANFSFEIPENFFPEKNRISSITGCFSTNWTNTEIPENLLSNLTKLNNCVNCFFDTSNNRDFDFTFNRKRFIRAKNLTTIPQNLFANNTRLSNISCLFENVNGKAVPNLTSIPENLFINCPDIIWMSNLFRNTNITHVPKLTPNPLRRVGQLDYIFAVDDGIAENNPDNIVLGLRTIADDFFDCFVNVERCTSLFKGIQIHLTNQRRLLSPMVKLKHVNSLFNLSKIETIEEGIFDTWTNFETCSYLFHKCYKLHGTLPKIFNSNHTRLRYIDNCFSNSGNTETEYIVPERFFADLSGLTECYNNFNHSKIISVGEKMFENCINLVNVRNNFNETNRLLYVDLNEFFKNCPKLRNVNYLFSNCRTLEYRNINKFFKNCDASVSNLDCLFENNHNVDCVKLGPLTREFFEPIIHSVEYCTKTFYFFGTNSGNKNTNWAAIPESTYEIGDSLLEGAPNLKKVHRMFDNNIQLKRIGNRIFANCPNLVDASWVFCMHKGVFNWDECQPSYQSTNNVKFIGNAIFNGCEKLENVTNGFSGMNAIQDIDFGTENDTNTHWFHGCTKLRDARYLLFEMQVPIDNEEKMIQSGIVTRPYPKWFLTTEQNPNLEYAQGLFRYCKLFSSIPDEAFAGFQNLKKVHSIFNLNGSLERIGNRIFADCPNLNDASWCFSNNVSVFNWNDAYPAYGREPNRLEYIGNGIFNGCTNLVSVQSCCALNKKLKHVDLGNNENPETLWFKGCTKLENAAHIFVDCSNSYKYEELATFEPTTIPSYMFEDSKSTLKRIEQMFAGSRVPLIIEDNAFRGLSNVERSFAMFANNGALISVGNFIFKDCIKSKDFRNMFISEGGWAKHQLFSTTFGYGLFSGCVAAENFEKAFLGREYTWWWDFGNPNNEEEHLFYNCTKAKNFRSTFENAGNWAGGIDGNQGFKFTNNLFKYSWKVIDNIDYVFAWCRLRNLTVQIVTKDNGEVVSLHEELERLRGRAFAMYPRAWEEIPRKYRH